MHTLFCGDMKVELEYQPYNKASISAEMSGHSGSITIKDGTIKIIDKRGVTVIFGGLDEFIKWLRI